MVPTKYFHNQIYKIYVSYTWDTKHEWDHNFGKPILELFMLIDAIFSRKYNVIGVLAMWEEDEDFTQADIFISSLERAVLCDEDSGDEDSGGNMNHLSGPCILAVAELQVVRHGKWVQNVIYEASESCNRANNTCLPSDNYDPSDHIAKFNEPAKKVGNCLATLWM